MRLRARVALVVLVAVLFGTSGCAKSQNSADPGAQTPTIPPRLQLQCEEQASALSCEARLSDDPDKSEGDYRVVTDDVRWTVSDLGAVSVRRGHIEADRGGVTSVTATYVDVPSAPSASIFVVANAQQGTARQGFVVDGEVRLFPSVEGVGDASVSLIDDHNVEQTIVTSPERPDRDTSGHFRFRPVPAGKYTLRALLEGYRTTQETITVPGPSSHVLTLVGTPPPHP
jgi:hypothetical protein